MEAKAMAVRERNWAQSIRAAEQSGMSQKAWCAAHGVCPSTFYRWKRSLKDKLLSSEQTGESPVCTFAELECPGTETYVKTPQVSARAKPFCSTWHMARLKCLRIAARSSFAGC